MQAHPTDKHCKREAKVLKLLEVLRQYCDFLRDVMEASLGSSAGKLAVKTAGCSRLSIQVVEGGEKYAEQDLMVCTIDCNRLVVDNNMLLLFAI